MKHKLTKSNHQSSVVCYLTSVSFFGFLSSAVCPLSSVFMQNKPNSPIVQTNVTNLITMNYTILNCLTKVKTKPIQTQNKPNSRKVKMNVNQYNTMEYKRFIPLERKQNKANSNPIKAKHPLSLFFQTLPSSSQRKWTIRLQFAIAVPATLMIDDCLHPAYNDNNNF